MTAMNETIDKDLITAMKERNADRVSVLRMLKTAVTNAKIQKKKENLDDSEITEIIQRQAKQRRESLESFENAKRTDLADKERRELSILESYLPKQLSDGELKEIIANAMRSLSISSKTEMGRLMKEVMPLVKGKADGKRVNEIISSLLA